MHNKTNEQIKRIAIKGAYGCGNFGDDALMVAVYEITKRLFDTESVIFICRDANYISKILPVAKVAQQDNMIAKPADVLVYGGGTQFCSFSLAAKRGILSLFGRIARNVRRPFQLGLKVLYKMTETIVTAPNQRVIAIGIGLGPFNENCRSMRNTKELFSCMEYIAVRDIYSYELCMEWGCNNVSLRSDLCYLPSLWNTCMSNMQLGNKKDKIRRIGVIIRDWSHTNEGDSYAAPLFQVVEELRSIGKEVNFISFANRYDSNWDSRLRDRNEQSISWDPEKYSISEFLELLSNFDAFITVRYHGAVFASILGKPVVCIEVEQKLRLVSDLFGAGARLWTYPFSASECLRHISDLEDDYSVAVECLVRVVKEQGSLVEKMIDEYRQFATMDPT
jgi:polysaccharide pyruvyl transferase WcaK-like protein